MCLVLALSLSYWYNIDSQYERSDKPCNTFGIHRAGTIDSVYESSSLCLVHIGTVKLRSLHHVAEQIPGSSNIFCNVGIFIKQQHKRSTALNAKYTTLAINCENRFYVVTQ